MDCDYPSLSLPVTGQCISEETLQCVGPFNMVSKFMNGGGGGNISYNGGGICNLLWTEG